MSDIDLDKFEPLPVHCWLRFRPHDWKMFRQKLFRTMHSKWYDGTVVLEQLWRCDACRVTKEVRTPLKTKESNK